MADSNIQPISVRSEHWEDHANPELKKMPISILLLGLARDCAETIPSFLAYIERLQAYGFKTSAIIGENGSRDQSRKLIEQATCEDLTLLDTSIMAGCTSRLVRMAMGRQALLDAADARGIREDYVCVVDLDNVMVIPPDPEQVLAAIGRLQADTTLFAVGATSLPVYYDLLSLRAEGYEFLSNLCREIANAKKKPLSYFRFHQEQIYRNQRLVTNSPPVLCFSSFNGFCCYNASDYRLGSYRAQNEGEVCEHVGFNLSIGSVTGKKMLISPDLTLRAPEDHISVGFFRFWYNRTIKRLVRS